MGKDTQLTAVDGHVLAAYLATPAGKPRAGLVVIQEVFGLTGHVRRVTDNFAAQGYLAIAPALFDRVAPGITLDYADVERGRDTMLKLDFDQTLLDIDAAVAEVRRAGRVAAVGYCWGGAMADLAACRLELDAAVSYYGGRITDWLDLQPKCPVLYHFGGKDRLVPQENVERIRAARPDGIFHIYPDAGHGFNCDERADFEPASARKALERTLAFLRQNF